jgi:hypothetical protein
MPSDSTILQHRFRDVSPRIALMMAKLERDPEAREVLEALERLRRAKGVGRW